MEGTLSAAFLLGKKLSKGLKGWENIHYRF